MLDKANNKRLGDFVMRAEKYVEDAKSDIDFKIDYTIKELEEYAKEKEIMKQ